MTQYLFLGFLAFLVAAIEAASFRYLERSTARMLLGGLLLWLTYVGSLSYLGVIRNPTLRPPGIAYILLPVTVFVFLGVVRSDLARRFASAVPLWLLIGFQCYRIGVELLLHRLWRDGLVPQMLTYRGANFDILIGLSAPVIAWLSLKGKAGLGLAFVWNILGLVALANIATRSLLTSPGPMHMLHTEVANLAFGRFPYTFVPGFFAPFAVILHVLALRSLRVKMAHLRHSRATTTMNVCIQEIPESFEKRWKATETEDNKTK
jgi:hypothetical protein